MSKKRTVWARIQEVLIEKRLPGTQAYAAEFFKVSQPAVSLWNKPGKSPDMELSCEVAAKLGVCVEWLLTERGPKRPSPKNDPMMDGLLQHWGALDEVDKRDLIGFASIRSNKPTDEQNSSEKSA